MFIIKKTIVTMYKFIFSFLGYILPKKENIIIFESFLGKQYSDNPRAIYEYLSENYPDLNMYWSMDHKVVEKHNDVNIKLVRRFSIRWLYLMNRAKFWVTNSRLPLWIPKPKNTIYIQTWHGTPLKKLALDMEEVHMPGTNAEMYKKNFIKETKKWDYLVSPNTYSTEIFNRAFDYKGKIIETGYPRNDYLIKNDNKQKISEIKKKLNIPENKKVIFYAPTWRDNEYYKLGQYKFDSPLDLKQMQKELLDETIILIRMHYLIENISDFSEYEGFVYDVSYYEDIRDLYLVADVLITDYSSVFFDYALLGKPIIFYVYDLEEYRDTLRGFYFDLEKQAPGPLVKNTEQVIKELRYYFNHKNSDNKLKTFRQKFCELEDGNASERVVNSTIMKSNNIK